MNNSKFLTLNLNDVGKGLVMAVAYAALEGFYSGITDKLPDLVQLQAIGITSLKVGIVYLLKNAFTNSENKLFATEK